MSQPSYSRHPPGGVIPVGVPAVLVLVRRPGLVVWAGAVTAFPEGFQFTLMTLFHTGLAAAPAPRSLALDVSERGAMTWLEVGFADGRRRAGDLNANTPYDQPAGPHLSFEYGEGSETEGWDNSRWWVTPLPPPGPVELAVHLDGQLDATGSGFLDGQALIDAAARTEVLWP